MTAMHKTELKLFALMYLHAACAIQCNLMVILYFIHAKKRYVFYCKSLKVRRVARFSHLIQ